MPLRQRFLRTHLVAWLIAAPPILGAIVLIAVDSSHDERPLTGTFAEAIMARDVEWAYAFIRAGQDPNDRIAFRNPELTGDRDVMVSPLLLAVARTRGHDDGFWERTIVKGERTLWAISTWAAQDGKLTEAVEYFPAPKEPKYETH